MTTRNDLRFKIKFIRNADVLLQRGRPKRPAVQDIVLIEGGEHKAICFVENGKLILYIDGEQFSFIVNTDAVLREIPDADVRLMMNAAVAVAKLCLPGITKEAKT